jgi:CRISPR-associated endonuclease Cas2
MTLIVAYDISHDKTRTQMVKFLQKRKGVRLQKSVFAVEIERHGFKRFLSQLEKIPKKTDKVAVFDLCKRCQQQAVRFNEPVIKYLVF